MQNPRPREISRAEGGVFSDTSRLEAVYGHSLILDREGLDLIVRLHCFVVVVGVVGLMGEVEAVRGKLLEGEG